jgi:predicted anti-sigma-YlaC factor YlaD
VGCHDADDLIEAMAEDEPVPADVATHVAGCARCRARVERARALDRLLRAREVPVPPEAFTLQVMRRVRQERWRVEQVVDAGFNVAIAAGSIVIVGGITGLLWSLGWFSVDVSALSTAVVAVAPWTTRLASEAQTLALAAVLLSSALALWWWVEGDGEASL